MSDCDQAAITLDYGNTVSMKDPNILLNVSPVEMHYVWMWARFYLLFNSTAHYDIIINSNFSHVCQNLESSTEWFQSIWYESKSVRELNINPFQENFVGVKNFAEETITVTLSYDKIYALYVFLTVCGALMFLNAEQISKSAVFYYSSGTVLGAMCSILLLSFIFSRFVPKKSLSAFLLVGGWSFTLYLMRAFYYNFKNVFVNYFSYFVGYLVIVSFISFSFCYYKGPIRNPRSLQLLVWSIQGIGIVFIFYSCQLIHYSVLFIAILALYKKALVIFMKFRMRLWFFRPKIKLLTKEEFRKQGEVETQKALIELREFCRSPDCNSWRVMANLSNPSRFASFIEGDSHLSDDELFDYENDHADYMTEDDSDDG